MWIPPEANDLIYFKNTKNILTYVCYSTSGNVTDLNTRFVWDNLNILALHNILKKLYFHMTWLLRWHVRIWYLALLWHDIFACWASCFLSFHWLSVNLKTGCPISLHNLWLFQANWDHLRDHFRDVPWEDVFNLSASAAASEYCEWTQVGINVYILHYKYQVKPHSSP